MKTRFAILFLLSFAILFESQGQQLTQTIRGNVKDNDTQSALIGATVIIAGSDPIMGATTDINGDFRIDNVPVGRVSLVITYVGYEDKTVPNFLVSSAKEVVLDINLTESINKLDEVVITATEKGEVLNEMALISARSFSVEETKRFAGSFDDPARMVSGFAGVNNNAEGNNDIIVRGNSPRGVLWRLEGVQIPNPNHFADEGATGGPINALNSKLLDNSDFFTGAFAPEYGNATSGVFDMKLRKGNNQKREHSATISTLGLDVSSEGPLGRANGGSYVANYRYSTLDLIDKIGIVDFGGVPRYQDAAFKIFNPIGKKHTVSIFGFGGASAITAEDVDPDDEELITGKGEMKSKVGVVGVNHNFLVNDDAYFRNSVSASATQLFQDWHLPEEVDDEFYEVFENDFVQTRVTLASTFNYKLNARHKFEIGAIYNRLGFNMEANEWNFDFEQLDNILADDGNTGTLQGFVSWKYRLTEDITFINGLHYMQLNLNDKYSLEPRASMQWKLDDKQTLTAGFGIHSKYESVATYLAKQFEEDGSFTTPNTNLGLTKAAHYVIGYDRSLGENTHVKLEAYYQDLYDVPIENIDTSAFSILNQSNGYTTGALVNEGTGRNYGVELTLERFFSNGFYYLGTASLYNSLYTAKDGIERSTAFNGNYTVNFLAGKEWNIGNASKKRTLFVNTKLALIGGAPYTPIDLEASRAEGKTVTVEEKYSANGDDVFKLDLAVGIRRNKAKTSTEFKIDVQNVTYNKAKVNEYYVIESGRLVESEQLPLFPTISYSIFF